MSGQPPEPPRIPPAAPGNGEGNATRHLADEGVRAPPAGSPGQAGGIAELSFEEALSRLEEIVEELESGQMPLEEALARFQEGVRLRAVCTEKLETAEARIEQVLAETAEMTGQDVEPEAEETGSA